MGKYISLACQSKSWNTWRGSIYHWSLKVNSETHDGGVYITGLSKKITKHKTGEYRYILPRHVFRDFLWKTSDIYTPVMCFGIYFERPVIYTPPSCVSGFTLTGQWYILPHHVFRDLRWETSDIYSPVMCFGMYFDRPMIYTSPSFVSGFTLTDQWYILPRHVFQDLLWQASDIYSPMMCFGIYCESRNTWRGSIYHWSVKVNPETHDGGVYITGLSK
jgi:hypothetical protein